MLFLGQYVSVTVDRPLGSRHPRYSDLAYPLNYGFLPGTLSGDGMEIDAYLLGIEQPIQYAEGVVMAVIVRADDGEDKLVVAPVGSRYSAEQVWEQVQFQERFFDSRVIVR